MIAVRALLLLAVSLGAFKPSGDGRTTPDDSAQPVCVQSHLLRHAEGGIPSTLAWQKPGIPGGRRVTVLFNDEGVPLQYFEMETSEPFELFNRNGRYRLVFVNLETRFAVVEIQTAPGDRIQEQREMNGVLHSAVLGSPSKIIELIRVECTTF